MKNPGLLTVLSFFLALTNSSYGGSQPPGTQAGFDRPPTNIQIRDRLKELCVGVLARGSSVALSDASSRCGCYAYGVVNSMSQQELDEMRVTGKFNASAKIKAEAYMQRCQVQIKRPMNSPSNTPDYNSRACQSFPNLCREK